MAVSQENLEDHDFKDKGLNPEKTDLLPVITEEESKRNRNFLILMIILTHVPYLFLNGTEDLVLHAYFAEILTVDPNPYTNSLAFFDHYPPLFYYLPFIWTRVFTPSAFGIRSLYLVFNVASVYGMHLIHKAIDLEDSKKYTFAIFYTVCPIVIILYVSGIEDTPGMFCLILGFYFFIKNRNFLSTTFIVLGGLYKIFPFMLAIPIFFFFVINKKYKEVILFIISFFVVFLLVCLPFIIASPVGFKKFLLSYLHYQTFALDVASNYPFIYESFTIYSGGATITITVNFFIQLFLIVLMFIFLAKKPFIYKTDIFRFALVIYALLPLITHRSSIDNWICCVPSFAYYAVWKQKYDVMKKPLPAVYLTSAVLLIVLTTISSVIFGFNVFQKITPNDLDLINAIYNSNSINIQAYMNIGFIILTFSNIFFYYKRNVRVLIIPYIILLMDPVYTNMISVMLSPFKIVHIISTVLFLVLRIYLIWRVMTVEFDPGENSKE